MPRCAWFSSIVLSVGLSALILLHLWMVTEACKSARKVDNLYLHEYGGKSSPKYKSGPLSVRNDSSTVASEQTNVTAIPAASSGLLIVIASLYLFLTK
ncbi:hypothetical protein Trydic_g14533 [Trypoxylus dichotomus]